MTEQAAPRPGFFKRNWKWLVPVGCLGPLLCCGGGVVAVVATAFGAMKSTPVYVDALARASSNPEVIEALGAPVTAGWWLSGSIQESGNGGTAGLAIPLKGSKATGTLSLQAEKVAGDWQYEHLWVDAGGRRIELAGDGEAEPDPVAEPREEDVEDD